MTLQHDFKPEQFTLDSTNGGLELDQEVAAQIANMIYHNDPSTRTGNNWREPPIVVDITGAGATHGINPGASGDSLQERGYRVALEGQEELHTLNASFAREMRAAFLDSERHTRLGWKGSVALSASVVAVFEGVPDAIALEVDMTGITKAELIAAGTLVTGAFLKTPFQNMRRLRIATPGTRTNERHLQAAERIAHELDLPPLIADSTPTGSSTSGQNSPP